MQLGAREQLSRFVYSRSKYSKKANTLKPDAWSPWPHPELSTAHTTALSEVEIWNIAKSTLTDQVGRDKVYARGDVNTSELVRHDLKAIRDDDPFERHTVIIGWPAIDDLAERKERWLEIALHLSQAATLFVCPTPITKDGE